MMNRKYLIKAIAMVVIVSMILSTVLMSIVYLI